MSSAQLVAPPWVRARALAIYQLSYNVTLAVFSFVWGWVGLHLGLSVTLYTAAGIGVLLAALARGFGIDQAAGLMSPVPQVQVTAPEPEAPAEELRASLPRSRNHVLEVLRYRVSPGDRAAFLAVMAEVRHVRGRTGAIDWQLFEDIAHPDSWLEAWVMQDWAEHMREAGRLSSDDRATLAAAAAFQEDAERPTSRYLAVDPEEG